MYVSSLTRVIESGLARICFKNHIIRGSTRFRRTSRMTNGCIGLEFVPQNLSTVTGIMAREHTHTELNTVKPLHRFGHGTADEMRELLAGIMLDQEKVNEACDKVHSACQICSATGQPAFRKKISLSNVNEAFKEEIKVDFLYAFIHGSKRLILNVVDVGTRYLERVLSPSRTTEEMKNEFEHGGTTHMGPRGACVQIMNSVD